MTTTIIDRLKEDVLSSKYFNDLFVKSSSLSSRPLQHRSHQNGNLTKKELTDLLRFADILSNSDDSVARNKSYQIISSLSQEFGNNNIYRIYSEAVLSKIGNFPALSFIKSQSDTSTSLPIERRVDFNLKKNIQRIPGRLDISFTDVQYQLFESLQSSNYFSFSGPTSMGKSFIIKIFIKEALNNKPKENMVIMVPTRALINQFIIELRNEIGSEIEKNNYRLFSNSNVEELSDKIASNYILILTPERLISYLSQKENPEIGFLFVDEAHKIASEKDIRSITTYTAVEKTLRRYPGSKLYFASPNVENPEALLNLFNKDSGNNHFKTQESPVAQNLFFIDYIASRVAQYIDGEEHVIENNFLSSFKNIYGVIQFLSSEFSNLVYCNSRTQTIERARQFCEMQKQKLTNDKEVRTAIRKIKSYVHKDYYLAEFLEYGVAYHYGNLPQIIRNIIEDLFRQGKIKFLFCTSTLLEGVNLPSKNLFILSNKNGLSKFKPIDFWNLVGRAGRLTKELFGNIYCIRDDEKLWKDTSLFSRPKIEIEPSVSSNTERNITKIESLLQNESIKGTKTEQDILKYIANIISIDTMQISEKYRSPLIDKLIRDNEEKIIELAKEKSRSVQVPVSILYSNQSIDVGVQDRAYNYLLNSNQSTIKLPNIYTLSYSTILEILDTFYEMYNWAEFENGINNRKSLRYFALLMIQWISGQTLNQIINQAIDFQKTNSTFYVNHQNVGPFNPGDKSHVNEIISDIIENIEKVLRFQFEKYFNHYHMLLKNILGEENAGENWALLLEYGTRDRIVIALQNLGLSRHAAQQINNNHKNCLTIEDSKIMTINKAQLLSQLDKEDITYEEVLKVL
ncbi:MAG: DEAD/DEAH box helicase [Cytophagales bacterium]|nr:DEAD/DEAH box helicase [Cytophagales bacterium]